MEHIVWKCVWTFVNPYWKSVSIQRDHIVNKEDVFVSEFNRFISNEWIFNLILALCAWNWKRRETPWLWLPILSSFIAQYASEQHFINIFNPNIRYYYYYSNWLTNLSKKPRLFSYSHLKCLRPSTYALRICLQYSDFVLMARDQPSNVEQPLKIFYFDNPNQQQQ